MGREIAQAFERGAKRLGTEVGQGVGQAVHKLFTDTRTNLVKNVEAHEKHDLESASALKKAAQHTDESPHTHAGGPVTPQQINGGASPHVPAGPTTKAGGGAPSVSDINAGSSPHVHGAPPTHESTTSPASTPPASAGGRKTTRQQMDEAQANVDHGAKTFADNDEAMAYGRQHWNDYVNHLPGEQHGAVHDYTRNDDPPDLTYKRINGELRSGNVSPEVQGHVDNIDKALAGHPTPEDVVVTRGTGVGHFPVDDPTQMTGRTVHDNGYTSASLGGTASVFDTMDGVLHLHVPKGTPAMWVENASYYGVGEREILLGRGSDYVVDHGMYGDDGKWHIYGHYLPRGGE